MCNSPQRNNIRQKLAALKQDIKTVKCDLKSIRTLVNQFGFSNLIPPKYKFTFGIEQIIQKNRFMMGNLIGTNVNKELLQQDEKQNVNCLNMDTHKNMNTHKYVNPNVGLKSSDVGKCQKRSKNKQNGELVKQILVELDQIRRIQKKEQSMRRINQKIRVYNSQQKIYRQENSYSNKRNKTTISDCLKTCPDSLVLSTKSGLSGYFDNNCPSIHRLSESITIDIPLCQQQKFPVLQKTKANLRIVTQSGVLKCSKGHQYYEGDLCLQKQIKIPHGHGRMEVCCSSFPTLNGSLDMKNSEYYQGHFHEGLFHGYGTLCYKGGVKYVGEFKDGKRSGRGSLYHSGKAETAKWCNDKFVSII